MTHLLDVNLLIALLWENHEHHQRARAWLAKTSSFATCPLVQLGFARISSHPQFGYAMQVEEAFQIMRAFLKDSRHRFIADDVSCTDRVSFTERIPGANHVTDHYLAALARQHGLTLATFDGTLASAFRDEAELVELLS